MTTFEERANAQYIREESCVRKERTCFYDQCHQLIYSDDAYFEHVTSHLKKQDMWYLCRVRGCHHVFTPETIQQHIKQHFYKHGLYTFECLWEDCDCPVVSQSLYVSHFLRHIETSKSRLYYKCEWKSCCFASRTTKGLNRHLLDKHTDHFYKCTCKALFKVKQKYLKHKSQCK